MQGDSSVPENPKNEVDFRYICFVKSNDNKHVYELDGDRDGPVDRGIIIADGEDMLGKGMLGHIKAFIGRYQHKNISCNLIALVSEVDG